MKAFELLSDRSKWLQRMYARDANGNSTFSESDNACSWCTIGAINMAYLGGRQVTIENSAKREAAIRLLTSAIRPLGFDTIPQWNDAPGRTYEEVVETLRKLDI